MDIKLDTDGDIDLTENNMTLVTETDAIAQHLKIRLRTFKGEWFLDTTAGMPYYQEFFVKNPSRIIMDARLREAILETPGIASLESIRYDFNAATRILSIEFDATLDSGTDFNFTFSNIVIGD